MTQSDKILGIDLGTTNSVLAVIQEGRAELLPIQGAELLPSVVGVSDGGEILVGTPARNQWVVAPDRTVRSIKRKMGSTETVTMAGRTYTPQEISAFILREIKRSAEAVLGHPVARAVITVPAYFNEVQRQATLEAGEIAGLQVERIINEPTAASLAHGYGLGDDENLHILVYDLGGGTFDVSLIELNYGVIDVLATAGDNHLGGDDFDERLAEMVADEFEAEHDIDLRQHRQSWARLLRAAEEAKIALSSEPTAVMSLEYLAEDASGRPLHIRREIERHEFEELVDDLLQSTIDGIGRALEDANLSVEQIDRVLLVGGSTRMPAVWQRVAQRMGKDPHAEIDPDAAVALGAAVQAGIIAGEEIDAILVDVTPLSLGIETAGFSASGQIQTDQFVPLIRRNTTIPVQRSELFTTLFPGQTSIQVKVYQGESRLASQNTMLGEFRVEDLEPDDGNGLASVNVNFQLDVNGILDVTVTERATGKQVHESLRADRQRLSPEQIAASQERLAATHATDGDALAGPDGAPGEAAPEDTAELDPGVRALLDRGQAALGTAGLDTDLAARIGDTMDSIRQAAADGDEDAVEEFSDQLIDLLFEVEE